MLIGSSWCGGPIHCLSFLADRDAKIGPGQVGLAAGAVVLGLLILITSAGDFTGGRNRYKNLRPSKAAPTGQEASLLMARAAALEDRLEANPG